MKKGFYTIMAAQFFSSLADNALLIAAIAMLVQLDGPPWLTPLLKFFFTVSYVVLAFLVGAFADSMPKGRVMFVTNTVKVVGCGLILFNEFLRIGNMPAYWLVLLAYAVVGLGAAAYSPAKYGILTELLPPEQLVMANGWIEGLTVASIVLGTLMGGMLIGPRISGTLLLFDFPLIDTNVNTAPEAAVVVIAFMYVIAALFNLAIPDTGARYSHQERNPWRLLTDFSNCFVTLWRDKLGQISLATTTLFWGAGATLQFIVLKWAEKSLNLPLSQGAVLQGVSALGIAIGAVLAARYVPLKRAVKTLPVGVMMGFVVMLMVFVKWMPLVYVLLVVVGAMAGFFVVPMNALLQHRGHVLMSAGHSIAVQNFNENVSILVMLALYSMMLRYDLHIHFVVVMFGLFVSATMYFVMQWNAANHRIDPGLDRLIGEVKH
jgi:MFS transporter, LPLT family, lysophospholipid transporter